MEKLCFVSIDGGDYLKVFQIFQPENNGQCAVFRGQEATRAVDKRARELNGVPWLLYLLLSFSLSLLPHLLLCLAASPMPASDISPSILRPSIASQKSKLTQNLYWGAPNHLTQNLRSLNKSPSCVISVISLAKALAIFGSTRWNNTLHLKTYKTR